MHHACIIYQRAMGAILGSVLGGKLAQLHGRTSVPIMDLVLLKRERLATEISGELRLFVYPVLSNSSRFVRGVLLQSLIAKDRTIFAPLINEYSPRWTPVRILFIVAFGEIMT